MNAIRDISSHEKVKRTNKKDCLSSKLFGKKMKAFLITIFPTLTSIPYYYMFTYRLKHKLEKTKKASNNIKIMIATLRFKIV